MNEWPLILWRFNCISTKEWDETCSSHLCLESANEDFIVGFYDNEVVHLISIISAGPKGGKRGTCPPEATTRHTLPPEKKLIFDLMTPKSS